jgi:oxygen-dependent protoporphyrinogen oxidase
VKRVVIIGGGITGLTTGLHLKDQGGGVPGGLEVVILEANEDPGGNIRTRRVEGFTIERGPNGYLDNVPTTPALVRRLGLEDQIQKADESAAKRFLYRKGRLHLLPTGPVGFLKSSVLSVPGRLRVFGEPFASSKPRGVDETIFRFGSRRIGKEATSILIDAMVSGVFAGNVHELSLAASFPKMAAMEEKHGGLVKAMVAGMKKKRAARKEAAARRARGEAVEELTRPGGPAGPGGTLTSFREGLDALPMALARELGGILRTGVEVTAVTRDGPGGRPWRVHLAEGEAIEADAVLVGLPSPKARPLLEEVDPTLSGIVGQIRTAPLAVVAVAYDAETMGGAPDGFGFLVPRGTGPRILGCLWDSSVFPGRAPEGKVLLRAMIGGAHDPAAMLLTNDELRARVLDDLRLTMGLEAEPLFSRVYRWRLGIGQYTVGHLDRIQRIEDRLATLPGLWLAGSSFYGISMNACIEKAGEQAGEMLEFLRG